MPTGLEGTPSALVLPFAPLSHFCCILSTGPGPHTQRRMAYSSFHSNSALTFFSQVTCLILGVLRFGTTGFTYFSFSGSSTIWPQGGSLSNITIATPHGINGFRNIPLTLSALEGGEVREYGRDLIMQSAGRAWRRPHPNWLQSLIILYMYRYKFQKVPFFWYSRARPNVSRLWRVHYSWDAIKK